MPEPIMSVSSSSTPAPVCEAAPPAPAPAPKPTINLELQGVLPMTDIERQAVLAYAKVILGHTASPAPIELPPNSSPTPMSPKEIEARQVHEACVAESKKSYEQVAKPVGNIVGKYASKAAAAVVGQLPGGTLVNLTVATIIEDVTKQTILELAGDLGTARGQSSCE